MNRHLSNALRRVWLRAAFSYFLVASACFGSFQKSNYYSIIAQNMYGVSATNALALNFLPVAVLQYDSNGNLTNDGTRVFYYDGENQLTNVHVAGQWQSIFVMDGFGRKRMERNYSWVSSAWQLTNEIHYVYDGNLAVQERDTNNNVLVTYTRGLDLSATRHGAGGIGGLLARSDANGSAYYHADGGGNITALNDGNGNIQAWAEYDAFGRFIKRTGLLSKANRYWFSSKEYEPQAAIYYYGRRFYEPNFGRWLSKDPSGERGGINLYRAIGNNPQYWIDTDGRGLAPNFGRAGNAALGNFLGDFGNNVQQNGQSDVNNAVNDLGDYFGIPDLAGGLPFIFPEFPPEDSFPEAAGLESKAGEVPPVAEPTPTPPQQPLQGPNYPKVPSQCIKDPSIPPGPGWQWKGKGPPGSRQGNWVNPETEESLHPDSDHGPPIGPHWDWTDPNENEWRLPNDGSPPQPK